MDEAEHDTHPAPSRRGTALVARAASALAVLAVLPSGCGDADPPDATPSSTTPPTPSATSTHPSPSPALPAYFLPAARDLPTRARLTAWQRVETADERVIGCQPDVALGAEEMIQRTFTARIAPADGLPGGEDVAAEVRLSVLQYASDTRRRGRGGRRHRLDPRLRLPDRLRPPRRHPAGRPGRDRADRGVRHVGLRRSARSAPSATPRGSSG